MTQVILGKSRVREIRMPGSVRAKAKWLSYSTIPRGKFHISYAGSKCSIMDVLRRRWACLGGYPIALDANYFDLA
jgi:hypothetical protein